MSIQSKSWENEDLVFGMTGAVPRSAEFIRASSSKPGIDARGVPSDDKEEDEDVEEEDEEEADG
jgi:hypothetical protein